MRLAGLREFWWDELEALLLSDIPLPTTIELEIEGERHRWISDLAGRGIATGPQQDPRWRAWLDVPTARHAVFVELWQRLQLLRDAPRQTVLKALWEIAARTREVWRVTPNVNRQLSSKSWGATILVDIGAIR